MSKIDRYSFATTTAALPHVDITNCVPMPEPTGQTLRKALNYNELRAGYFRNGPPGLSI